MGERLAGSQKVNGSNPFSSTKFIMKTKKSISLIGMAGTGKSTIGNKLAQYLGFNFIDSDLLIEKQYKKSLQEILVERGNKSFKDIEQNNLMSIKFNDLVLATGGSAIFSELAMSYISKESTIIFIESSYKDIISRVPDFSERGFLKKSEQNIKEAFAERGHLYKYYADFTVLNNAEIDQCIDKIVEIIDKKI